jgi:hypothetical protein
MKLIPVLLWALLYAAPVFSQQALWSDPRISTDGLKWFQLVESESEVRKYLGQPAMVADFGEYRSWQYQIGEVEHDDFSHALVFRKSDGKLVSVSRTYNPERSVDSLFPPSGTTVHWFRAAGQPDFPMRIRRLPGGRVLMAVGTSKPGQTTGQLVLMSEKELPHFYPWLAEDLTVGAR